ncbi:MULTISPECIES: hypothetical protein [Pseudoalteromonas]|uniref:Uncharacterized protein n=1 Tax=Pseudoalteromonas haloplanktis TaxID=228 RepID=A0ABU1BEG8_PSEHA|nr:MULTISPECIES: hypothetical protein [Pseudoalteromonas]MDQ9092319.1 hypothetical protein [Pseudoalteromonas haloplanktis]TMN72016.1 hypothetical protein CWB85_08470 [Pseudoalteromonas sp. S1727]
MEIALIIAALAFSGASVYCFCKANFCACTRAGQCDNPVNHYWLGAIIFALIALLFCCGALHTEKGTLLWLLLMVSCFSGALLSAKQSAKKRCDQSKIKKSLKPADALLTNEPN